MGIEDSIQLGRALAKPKKIEHPRERILFVWDHLDEATAIFARGYAVNFLIKEIVSSTRLHDLDIPGDILTEEGTSFQVVELTPKWSGGSYNSYSGEHDDPDLNFKDPVWRKPTDAEWDVIRSGNLEKLNEVWKDIPNDEDGHWHEQHAEEANAGGAEAKGKGKG